MDYEEAVKYLQILGIQPASYKAVDDIFRPPTFKDFIGQPSTKHLLSIMIRAAQKEKRDLPNIMIVGGFGLGKTALATLTLKEFGKPPKLIDGTSINKGIPEESPIIVDEIHNVTSEMCDTLNTYLDDGRLSIIGCTTNPGKLPAAFRSRFRTLHLTNYSEEELTQIAFNICKRKGVTANTSILNFIAQRSRNNARHIVNYLGMIFDLMATQSTRVVTEKAVNEAFGMLGVDEDGLLSRDRDYLSKIKPTRPVGLGWLSAVLGIDQQTIEEEIEPYLLQKGLIDRTPRGRIKL